MPAAQVGVARQSPLLLRQRSPQDRLPLTRHRLSNCRPVRARLPRRRILPLQVRNSSSSSSSRTLPDPPWPARRGLAVYPSLWNLRRQRAPTLPSTGAALRCFLRRSLIRLLWGASPLNGWHHRAHPRSLFEGPIPPHRRPQRKGGTCPSYPRLRPWEVLSACRMDTISRTAVAVAAASRQFPLAAAPAPAAMLGPTTDRVAHRALRQEAPLLVCPLLVTVAAAAAQVLAEEAAS